MNTIIIAVIALIVLVVVVMIFMNTQGGFTGGLTNCEDKGGECEPGDECSEGSHYPIGDSWCKKNNKGNICCIS